MSRAEDILATPLLPDGRPVTPFVDATPLLGDPAGLRRLADELGYLYLPQLLPAALVDPVRAVVREACVSLGWVEPDDGDPPRLRARPGAVLRGHGWDDPDWVALQRTMRRHEAFRALSGAAPLLGALEALWGEPARLATANMCWVKLPGSPAQTTRPHQDRFYLRDSPRFWTAWLPIVDTPFPVGPLAVVPGSHHDGLWPHIDNLTGIDVPPDVGWASGAVRPGDVVLFGELTIHCAWSNVSPTDVRVSFDIRYEPASTGDVTELRPAPFEGP